VTVEAYSKGGALQIVPRLPEKTTLYCQLIVDVSAGFPNALRNLFFTSMLTAPVIVERHRH
jgi:hypothetical protein